MDLAWAADAAGGSDGGGSTWSLVWIALGVVMIVFITRRQTRLADQRAAARNAPRPIADDGENARRAVDQALVNLADMSREISAQIDTKIRLLNRLVKDADDCIRRLEALLNHGERPAEAASPTGLHARVRELRDVGKTPAEIARATGLSLLEVNVALRQLEQ